VSLYFLSHVGYSEICVMFKQLLCQYVVSDPGKHSELETIVGITDLYREDFCKPLCYTVIEP
jgi:hypothetical protein